MKPVEAPKPDCPHRSAIATALKDAESADGHVRLPGAIEFVQSTAEARQAVWHSNSGTPNLEDLFAKSKLGPRARDMIASEGYGRYMGGDAAPLALPDSIRKTDETLAAFRQRHKLDVPPVTFALWIEAVSQVERFGPLTPMTDEQGRVALGHAFNSSYDRKTPCSAPILYIDEAGIGFDHEHRMSYDELQSRLGVKLDLIIRPLLEALAHVPDTQALVAAALPKVDNGAGLADLIEVRGQDWLRVLTRTLALRELETHTPRLELSPGNDDDKAAELWLRIGAARLPVFDQAVLPLLLEDLLEKSGDRLPGSASIHAMGTALADGAYGVVSGYAAEFKKPTTERSEACQTLFTRAVQSWRINDIDPFRRAPGKFDVELFERAGRLEAMAQGLAEKEPGASKDLLKALGEV